jgi:hypothetical protein
MSVPIETVLDAFFSVFGPSPAARTLYDAARAELAALREENARLRAALTSQDVRFGDIGLRVDSSTEILSRCEDGRREIAVALTGTPSGLAVVPVARLREIEYAATSNDESLDICPVCRDNPHKAECWLAQAIESAEKGA